MTANVGSIDRVLRFLPGVLLIVAPFAIAPELLASPFMSYGALAVGAILIVTALFKFCPLYRLFGICSCKTS